MLFAPQMAQLPATTSRRRPHAPAAPHARRDLLRGLRPPRRSRRAVAAGRLLPRASGAGQPAGRRRTRTTGTRSVETAS